MTLQISKNQAERLSNESLANRIILTLRQEFSEDLNKVDPKQLKEAIQNQIKLAREYGFWSEYGVATFVVTAWMLGLGFDRNIPAVAECLARDDMLEEEKALWLEQFTTMLFTKLSES